MIFTSAGFEKLITTWGGGDYGIVAFAFQMILILVTGHCLALTPAVNRILVWIAGIGNTPVKGGMIVAFVTGICSFINWGFGLIVGGLLALQVAKRTRQADFPFLIASAYSGYVVWHQGLSGSIPLAIATAKLPQNFIEQMTGAVVPVSQSIFQPFNYLPAVILVFTIPILMALIHPKEDEIQTIPEDKLDGAVRRLPARGAAAKPHPGGEDRPQLCDQHDLRPDGALSTSTTTSPRRGSI